VEEIYGQHVAIVDKCAMEEWHDFGSIIENMSPIQNTQSVHKISKIFTVILLEIDRSLLFYLYI
jgi:hypothetical protein